MNRFTLSLGLMLVLPFSAHLGANELPEETRNSVNSGLAWLVKQQHADGHWEANGGNYSPAMTALAGIALLGEGSTVRDGKYAENIRKAADWFVRRAQPNGVLIDPKNQMERGRYMYGHGFGLLFLSQVYGEEEDADRRKKLEAVLTKAVEFTCKAQSTQGGYYYTSAADGHDADEGSVTVTQVQALRAARNAGIVVPKETIDKCNDYLKKATTDRGGIVYSLGRGMAKQPVGGERPALTAAAVCCGFSFGEYDNPFVKKWLQYCRTAIPINQAAAHDDYVHLYMAQTMYILGDKGWARLFPDAKESEAMTWSKYRDAKFKSLMKSQARDGSWSGNGGISPVYSTSIALIILQLDRGCLPIFQR